jgi:hypothetical protein
MRDIAESEWILSNANAWRVEQALEKDRCPECGSGNWSSIRTIPFNDCAEIWPYEQIWHTCVDEPRKLLKLLPLHCSSPFWILADSNRESIEHQKYNRQSNYR